MQDIFGSVRRSLVFRSSDVDEGGLMRGIGACLRKSRIGFLPKAHSNVPMIRWRKGELIGCGAYGRVYMGMNLDSGELLAVKQVLIAANGGSKERAQAHIRELEEEVKLLRNLSHQNIVRYLGTDREEEALNILLEFVPGGSISSLLGKLGSFPETVIRKYTKQLLQGLEYLHKNGIIHRDIKGANILVDNKGCIKLADFGASKKVVELATVSGAKSMKGTPYWMAPEVICQTGHSFSADIWSVGCTVIEMATGKPPWSQQYQEVAALFIIGSTKSHPPIPEHLSEEAKDFLLKCLQEEPNVRPTASELLQHPFVIGECEDPLPSRTSVMEQSVNLLRQSGMYLKNSFNMMSRPSAMGSWQDVPNLGSVRASAIYPNKDSRMGSIWESGTSGDLCRIDDNDEDDLVRLDFSPDKNESTMSCNPMSEPQDDWESKFNESMGQRHLGLSRTGKSVVDARTSEAVQAVKERNDIRFSTTQALYEEDDEVTESKISAFLDEKALELKKLQNPLYEEYYNTINAACLGGVENRYETCVTPSKLPPKSKSPNKVTSISPGGMSDRTSNNSSGISSRRVSYCGNYQASNTSALKEVPSPKLNEWKGFYHGGQQNSTGPSASCFEMQRLWKEELDQELERKREEMKKRLAANGGKSSSSPKDRISNRNRDRSMFASPGQADG
ncbi:hypothetical protein AMTRI_Chr09g42630 [Amborella trichopoda]